MKLLEGNDLYLAGVLALVTVAGWGGSRTAKHWAAVMIGSTAYWLSARKRRLSEEHLVRAMPPPLAPEERRAIVERSFRAFWRETFSLVLSPSERQRLAAAEVHGIEQLRMALRRGKGAILWESSSFGWRLAAKQILKDHGFAVHQVHGDDHLGGFRTGRTGRSVLRQRILQPAFERHERRSVVAIIHISDSGSLAFTRVMQRCLREGAVVCTSSDGPLGHKFVAVPFLGDSQPFATGVVSHALMSGTPLLPMFCFEEPSGRPRLVIEPPLVFESGRHRDRVVEDALTRYVRLLESYIRRYPSQYRAWHSLGRPAIRDRIR
jgi:lauroyl/myristoyl acyltransferase